MHVSVAVCGPCGFVHAKHTMHMLLFLFDERTIGNLSLLVRFSKHSCYIEQLCYTRSGYLKTSQARKASNEVTAAKVSNSINLIVVLSPSCSHPLCRILLPISRGLQACISKVVPSPRRNYTLRPSFFAPFEMLAACFCLSSARFALLTH